MKLGTVGTATIFPYPFEEHIQEVSLSFYLVMHNRGQEGSNIFYLAAVIRWKLSTRNGQTELTSLFNGKRVTYIAG